ncbi:PIN domain-containing protein [Rhizohabitans arisaemae]|uniref:PIN domain-containing protein n=1 Tax=Rhizohabitans arisaemae TaxID=2720610 RepID=UPI0024B0DA99|nr:PIN domain-containing protein [Rhizohabitans arisaemae]
MARVFIDTNVLFPFSVMDLMLGLSEDAIHTVVWSDHLLDEWERVIVREHHRSAEAASRISRTIREFFADTRVPEDDYKHLIDRMEGPDLDDHHHMAAAIAGHALTLVTWNLGDFPTGLLSEYGLTVTDPDSYLCSLLTQCPREVVDVLFRMAAGKRRPPMNASEIVDALDRAGVPVFARRCRTHLAATSGDHGPYRPDA